MTIYNVVFLKAVALFFCLPSSLSAQTFSLSDSAFGADVDVNISSSPFGADVDVHLSSSSFGADYILCAPRSLKGGELHHLAAGAAAYLFEQGLIN